MALGSDTPVGKGGTLDLDTLTIVGAVAPYSPMIRAPGVPPPPEYLPEMKDELIVRNSIRHSPQESLLFMVLRDTGKSTVFPLAVTHWTERTEGLQSGLTICAQPKENTSSEVV